MVVSKKEKIKVVPVKAFFLLETIGHSFLSQVIPPGYLLLLPRFSTLHKEKLVVRSIVA